jgi:sugar phosphate isomerase/epimerase
VGVLQVADNLPLHELSAAELNEFASLAGELGIEVELGTRGIADGNLARYVELAAQLDVRILRMIVDSPGHEPGAGEVVTTVKESLPALKRADVILAIENHDRFKATALRDLCQRIDSPQVGICLDNANSFGAMEGPEVVVEVLGPLTVNLHVKGFTVHRQSHGLGFLIEGCPMRESQLELEWLLGRMRELGRDVNVILEQWTPPKESLSATIAREATWAADSIAYMKELIPG